MVKKLLKNNIVSLIMIALVLVIYFVANNLVLSLVFLLVCLVYTIWNNMGVLIEESNSREALQLLKKNKKYRWFEDYIDKMDSVYKGSVSKLDSLKELEVSESIIDAADKIVIQIGSNVDACILYIKTYSYQIDEDFRSYNQYLERLCIESKNLEDKLEELINLVFENKKSADDIDLSSVDDILEALKEVSKFKNS